MYKRQGQIRYAVDLSAYQNRVSLINPEGDTVEAVAAPIKPTESDSDTDDQAATDSAASQGTQATNSVEGGTDNGVLYQVEFPPIDGHGFDEMKLQNNDGGETPVCLRRTLMRVKAICGECHETRSTAIFSVVT